MKSIRYSSFCLAATLLLGSSAAFAQDDASVASPASKTPTVFDDPALVERYQQTITPQDLAAHLYLIASDLFEGREATTRGQKLTARYLASEYVKMGLKPRGTVETDDPYDPMAYYEPFDVYGQRLKKATLGLKVDGQQVATSTFSADDQDDLAYFVFGGRAEATGSVVFAGYGITDPDLHYDDFAALAAQDVSLANKWVMIMRDEPLANDSTSLLPTPDGKLSSWSRNTFQKMRAAQSAAGGTFPLGFLVVNDVGPRATVPFMEQAQSQAAGLDAVGRLSLEKPEGGGGFPPVYVISSKLANEILQPTGRTIDQIKRDIDGSLEPEVYDVTSAEVSSQLENEIYTAGTENIAAYIEGSDPVLKDEFVVVSAHMDHIGLNPTAEGDDHVNNGADDDGSGTVSTLEIAEAFMKAKEDGHGPRRSILFLNVTGEEKGLLGSEYFADTQPTVPLDKIVTDLNIDMIGRIDPTYPGDQPQNYVYIIGSNLISKELDDINTRVNQLTDLNMDLNQRFNTKDDPNRFYQRSDHWNFGKHGIPFIFYFNGTHEDYHGLGDEPQKIAYDKMAATARLIFATAWQVANQDNPPAVSGTGFN